MTFIGNLRRNTANQRAYLDLDDGRSLLLTTNVDCEEAGFRAAFNWAAGHEGRVSLDGTVGTCGVHLALFLSGLAGDDPTKPH